jgi:hopanoid-associated phosphorylase
MKMLFDDAPVIAAVGMTFESRIAKGPGVRAVCGQNRAAYVRDLDAAVRAGARGIVSFGVAGGLCPSLKPGDVVVASSVVTANRRYETHARWSHSLRRALPHPVSEGALFAADDSVMTVLEKEALLSGTGAVAVDVESGVAAEAAERYGLPFAVLRVVLDPASRSLPLSATVGVRDDGHTNVPAVLLSLIRRPGELPEMIRLASDARRASRSLLRSRQALGPFFSLLDPLALPLNVE